MKHTVACLESFAVMALLAMGLTGAAYHLFRDGGWLDLAGGSLWSFILDAPTMALAAVGGAVVITWLWHRSREFRREDGKAATGVFYVMVAAGLYFAAHLVLAGTL